MTLTSFRKHLAKLAEEAGSQRNLAKRLGISPMFICDVLKGRRDPGDKMLKAMGFERRVSIRRTVEITEVP